MKVSTGSKSLPPAASPYLARKQSRPGTVLSAQRGHVLSQECPSQEILKHVTSRWGVLVLIVLQGRTHRFSELRRSVGGVSERMLTQTLQWLEADGLIHRVAFNVVPPHVEYSLTELGVEAAAKVRSLADWIEINLHRVLANRKTLGGKGTRPSAAPAGQGRAARPSRGSAR
jgi:DNA-binding HxlR family transcriptional regulator